MDTNSAASGFPCGRCTTHHACAAYKQCLNKPLVKAHPASSLVDPVLARVADLTGAETDGFLPETPAVPIVAGSTYRVRPAEPTTNTDWTPE